MHWSNAGSFITRKPDAAPRLTCEFLLPPVQCGVSCLSQVISTLRQGRQCVFYSDHNTKVILLAKGDTQWQVVDSCSEHDPHAACPDFGTHYYVDDPSYGCGDDAADLDCFSADADPGPDYDYGWKRLFDCLKSQSTSSGL